jgi:uncharacterized membrane protein YkvA (DUF1232 family)
MSDKNTGFTDEDIKNALRGKEQEAEALLKNGQKVEETLSKAQKLLARIKKIPIIGGMVDDIATMIDLIRAYVKGEYREVPFRVIVSAMAGIIYLLSPIDIIPDPFPVLGYVDDAAVLALALSLGLSSELSKYRKWKAEMERARSREKAREDYIKEILKEKGKGQHEKEE